MGIEQGFEFRAGPAQVMDAIGDVPNVEPREHLSGDLAMQLAHPVAGPRKVQSEDGGIELVFPGETANRCRQIGPEGLVGQVIGEFVMSGRHRGVSSKDAFLPNLLLIAAKFPQERQGQKDRMAFIHVIGGDSRLQAFEGEVAADAQNGFLADPRVVVPTVKKLSDQAVFGSVYGQVGVQKIDGDATL